MLFLLPYTSIGLEDLRDVFVGGVIGDSGPEEVELSLSLKMLSALTDLLLNLDDEELRVGAIGRSGVFGSTFLLHEGGSTFVVLGERGERLDLLQTPRSPDDFDVCILNYSNVQDRSEK